jgi:hypothetical protein
VCASAPRPAAITAQDARAEARQQFLEANGLMAIGHQCADQVRRYNKDEASAARCEAFEKVSEHIAAVLVDVVSLRKRR